MLRECPIDHRCMTGISAARVFSALTSGPGGPIMRPAVLLDRDGTINDDVGYLTDVADLVIYPCATDAIRLLRRAGYAIVVITNQGGIARGLATTALVEATHARWPTASTPAARTSTRGATVRTTPRRIAPELAAPCRCRKPGTGHGARRRRRELGLDLSRSWVIGDHWRDVQLGHAVGARSILLRTGHGRDQEAARPPGQRVEAICDNLMHAVAVILTGVVKRESGVERRESGVARHQSESTEPLPLRTPPL